MFSAVTLISSSRLWISNLGAQVIIANQLFGVIFVVIAKALQKRTPFQSLKKNIVRHSGCAAAAVIQKPNAQNSHCQEVSIAHRKSQSKRPRTTSPKRNPERRILTQHAWRCPELQHLS